jgi:hypothetical protein
VLLPSIVRWGVAGAPLASIGSMVSGPAAGVAPNVDEYEFPNRNACWQRNRDRGSSSAICGAGVNTLERYRHAMRATPPWCRTPLL